MKFFKIKKKRIGKNMPTYFIADIGANHDGSLARAKKLIRLAKLAGADAAKFQHFSAKTIVSDVGFKKLKNLKSHQSKWKKSVFSVYQAASINKKWTKILKKFCDKIDIEFMTSPYSMEIVDEINPYVNVIKIGSGDITWIDIIKKIASKKKLGIIATGASNFKEVETAVKEYLKINQSLVLMQCNTNYTGDLENIKYSNLNVINKFKKKFPKVVLGLSDHTFGHVTVLGAVMLGARVIEKHFTDDNKRTGPDHFFAMNPKSWKSSYITIRRGIRANQKLNKGSIIREHMLDYLRPCPFGALRPCDKKKIINKRLKKDIKYHEIIKSSDVF